jgi:predicted amidohydrolase YtcJ
LGIRTPILQRFYFAIFIRKNRNNSYNFIQMSFPNSCIRFYFLILVSLLFGCQSKREVATMILHHADIFTADSSVTKVTAVAVLNDRIIYIGDDATALKYADKSTKIIDLQGKFLMPGFIEGHGHFESLGNSLQTLNLMPTKTWAEIIGMVAEKSKTTQVNDWIEGRGWHQEKWTSLPAQNVGGYPLHQELSAASPNNPVVLYHASGHSLFANAKAMELAGISTETSDPIGGRIVRDTKGHPVGVFEENAMDLIGKPYTSYLNKRNEDQKVAQFNKSIALASEACLKNGITSFQDAGSSFWEVSNYQKLAETQKLDLRLWVMIMQPKKHEFEQLDAFPKIGLGNNHLTVRAVKAYLDGALGSYGAWLLEEYSDKPGFFGQNTTPMDTIAALAEVCKNKKMQFCVHAIGDRGNREVLNIFEKTCTNLPNQNLRWRMEHTQHTDPQDIPRFQKLGVIASMQAIHCTSDAPFVVKRLGETRARKGAYAWRSLLNTGAHLANGTDTPVEDVNPLPCLYASITRKRADTGFEFFPEQAMTRHEALLSYTIWNAYAAFEEKEKGSISLGKLADFVILDKNLLTCVPEDIMKASVLKTIVGGVVKFEK